MQFNRSFVVHGITFALADNVFEFVYENLLLVLRLKVNFKVTKNVFKHWNIEIGKLFFCDNIHKDHTCRT